MNGPRTVPADDLDSIMSWIGAHVFFIGFPSDGYEALTPEERAEHLKRLAARMQESIKDIGAEAEVQRSGTEADKELLRTAAVELFVQALHLAGWLGMQHGEVTYRIPDAIDSARKLLD